MQKCPQYSGQNQTIFWDEAGLKELLDVQSTRAITDLIRKHNTKYCLDYKKKLIVGME